MSGIIGLFAAIGAVAAILWAFGGQRDERPSVDEVFRRIRGKAKRIDAAGVEGAHAALYPPSARTPCQWCDVRVSGAHQCSKRPHDALDEAFEVSRGKLATVRPIRRAS